MTANATFEIFLQAAPGLELIVKDEAAALGFKKPKAMPGGVRFRGNWRDVWRANLEMRCAGRVMVRIGGFQAMHLSQLEKQTAELPWLRFLRRDVPVKVEVTCRKSKIYHAGAASERIERALSSAVGIPVAIDAPLQIKVRIEDNQCSFSLDTSGEPLHKRGNKGAVGKAPMRETLAASFLRQCGYDGTEPVLDPMCGSGTFVIEAAEIARGLKPGRSRAFAFEKLATFDADIWADLQSKSEPNSPEMRFFGSDRNKGAVTAAEHNAKRAGVEDLTEFAHCGVSEIQRPSGSPGLVIVNPPYGTRIGEKKQLFALHGALGKTMLDRFRGWRVGIITTDGSLAKATGLPFLEPGPPVAHGGLRVKLYRTDPL